MPNFDYSYGMYSESVAQALADTDNNEYVAPRALCNGTLNQTENCQYDYDDMPIDGIISIVVPILFGIIVVVGLFGNALVVIVVLFNHQVSRAARSE